MTKLCIMHKKYIKSDCIIIDKKECSRCIATKKYQQSKKGMSINRLNSKKYYEKNKNKVLKKVKRYSENNKEKIAKRKKIYFENYYKENRENILTKCKSKREILNND